jgi:hypothetical protein
LLDGRLEGRQRLVPEPVEISAQLADTGGIELVDPTRPHGAVDDQPRVLEHFEVLGDRRPADRHVFCQLTYGARAIGETLEDRPSRRICERRQSINLVSLHAR